MAPVRGALFGRAPSIGKLVSLLASRRSDALPAAQTFEALGHCVELHLGEQGGLRQDRVRLVGLDCLGQMRRSNLGSFWGRVIHKMISTTRGLMSLFCVGLILHF